VIEAFKVIYHNDKVAREEKMPADARLTWHQTHWGGDSFPDR
jgi:hypothetical protein